MALMYLFLTNNDQESFIREISDFLIEFEDLFEKARVKVHKQLSLESLDHILQGLDD